MTRPVGFTPEAPRVAARLAPLDPILLVGCERSGTTMLRLMLDHHPQIAFRNEFEFTVDLVSETGWPPLCDYYEYLEHHRNFQDSGLEIDPTLDYPSLARDFLGQFQRRRGKPVVGATIHQRFDLALRIWPEARYIHLIRDGRDVARSVMKMGWAGNLWAASRRWIEAERIWDRLRGTLPPDRFIEVRYEELVADPPGELARLCEFAGVPYDPAMLAIDSDTTYESPDPKYSYQWRRNQSPADLGLVEASIGDLLEERGYEPSGHPRRRMTPGLRRRLLLQDRLGRARHRWQVLGPGLFLENFVARRLGWRSWRLRVQDRIADVTRRRLK